MSTLTTERGRNYGHPRHQFVCVEKMYVAWTDRRDAAIASGDAEDLGGDREHCLRHSVYMMLTKLSRAATNPMHIDNWDDIEGYAECFKMCVEDGSQTKHVGDKNGSEDEEEPMFCTKCYTRVNLCDRYGLCASCQLEEAK